MPLRHFYKLYADRYQWAFHAYDQFIAGLEQSVADAFQRKDQITVVLYGHTQAGKTTVLLTLLGVEETYFPVVSGILRGGRDIGRSATATAMIYSKSESRTWSLNDKDGLSDEEMLSELIEIRRKVNQGTYQKVEPIYVKIPAHYFHETIFDKTSFQIIDLPGTHCADNNEGKLVEKIARVYVPLADMVLIVNDASKLTNLEPTNMSLESLKTWFILPEKFLLVLTHTFTLSSSKKDFLKESDHSVEAIRSQMMTRLKKHLGKDNCPPESAMKFLFPVDCGDSLRKLKNNDPDAFKIIHPVILDLFEDLSEHIRASATQIGRVRMAGHVKPLAKKIKRVRMEKYEEDISKSVEEKNKLINDKKKMEDLIGNIDKEKDKYAKKVPLITDFLQKWGETEQTTRIKHDPDPSDKPALLSNVKRYLDDENEKMDSILGFKRIKWKNLEIKQTTNDKTSYKGLRKELESLSHPEIPHLDDSVLYECSAQLDNIDEEKLGGSWLPSGGGGEKYWWTSNYIEDCKKVSTAAEQAFNRTKEEVYHTIPKYRAIIQKEIGRLEQERAGKDATRKRTEAAIAKVDEELKRKNAEKEEFLHNIDYTIRQASEIHVFFARKYEAHYQEVKEKYEKEKDLEEKFCRLCYMHILQKETRSEIIPS